MLATVRKYILNAFLFQLCAVIGAVFAILVFRVYMIRVMYESVRNNKVSLEMYISTFYVTFKEKVTNVKFHACTEHSVLVKCLIVEY